MEIVGWAFYEVIFKGYRELNCVKKFSSFFKTESQGLFIVKNGYFFYHTLSVVKSPMIPYSQIISVQKSENLDD